MKVNDRVIIKETKAPGTIVRVERGSGDTVDGFEVQVDACPGMIFSFVEEDLKLLEASVWSIYFYHMWNSDLAIQLLRFCDFKNKDTNELIFNGSLDDFAMQYNNKFMVDYDSKTIIVTHKKSFRQC